MPDVTYTCVNTFVTKCGAFHTHKRFKITLFIRTKHNMRIFEVIPFIKLQNGEKQ